MTQNQWVTNVSNPTVLPPTIAAPTDRGTGAVSRNRSPASKVQRRCHLHGARRCQRRNLTLLWTPRAGLDSLLVDDFSSSVATYASTNNCFDSYFAGGLTGAEWRARHLTGRNETPTALSLQQDLAQANGLTLGDTITLRMSTRPPCWDMIPMTPVWKNYRPVPVHSKSTGRLLQLVYGQFHLHHVRGGKDCPARYGRGKLRKITFYGKIPANWSPSPPRWEALPELSDGDFLVTADNSER